MKEFAIITTPATLSSDLYREIAKITFESMFEGRNMTEADLAEMFDTGSAEYTQALDAMRKGKKVKKFVDMDERSFARYIYDIIKAMERSDEICVVDHNL